MKKFASLFLALIFAMSCSSMMGQDNSTSSLTLDQNLLTPQVPSRANGSVSRYIDGMAKKFREKGLEAKSVRNGEVLQVTIPAADLFAPNESKLKAGADVLLGYFAQAVNHPQSYRIVIAVFADDTGDEQYSMELTSERAESVVKGISRTANSENRGKLNIDSYWFGNSRYIVPNNTIVNRAKNRRVEIYLVPEKAFIEASRAG